MNTNSFHTLGIDVGSTTAKIVILNKERDVVFSDYERHYANIQETLSDLLNRALYHLGSIKVIPVMTGSGGLALAEKLEIDFIQEVIAVSTALQDYAPETDVAIELGGEDAKIIYFERGNVEQRMNGICAGGTGSFIDQMASLLQTDAHGLNELAKNYKAKYHIAARCGVFAKSDIQPLINEGASKEDLAASIFQAVVAQTISGLACGKPIRGHVAFLGGPLHFLSQLRKAFVDTLALGDDCAITPLHSHLFAAIGAALTTESTDVIPLQNIQSRLSQKVKMEMEIERLEPFFNSKIEYDDFITRHQMQQVPTTDIDSYKGNAYLGIDAGSTTTKLALVSEDGALLYSFYKNNEGDPLGTTIEAIKDIYNQLPKDSKIVHSCSTGYGEALMKAAFKLDVGEVETVAHYYAASFFEPDVDCIIDIGGQDMKCIKIRNQAVDSVQLNEACSSGCGSFIETFAHSLNYSVEDFATEALYSKTPIDLGTRCTVFMNSRVKQAQKEGASVADISAGLAYSVVKNALFKVFKASEARELGSNIVVQGGTLYNDAVLRSFERVANCHVIRPDIAGIMGAFGAALIAKERYQTSKTSSMLTIDEINTLEVKTSMTKCKACNNNCRLTINKFGHLDSGLNYTDKNRTFISGNRCEQGLGQEKSKNNLPNLFEYKTWRYFDYYTPISKEEALNGVIGLPRVLNVYENYPFWVTFFNHLGFSTILSPLSTRELYELGIESIPSESECYPAKLVHGHIEWLINQGVTRIFYPSIPYERKEFSGSQNHYNCPIVTSYPENIKNNVETIRDKNIELIQPFLSFTNINTVTFRLVDVFAAKYNIPPNKIKEAVKKGWREVESSRADLQRKGEETIELLNKTGKHGIVLAGRPYHLDPEVHHGVPEMINAFDVAVLTEDSISHLGEMGLERPLNVMDQWTYHSRLYAAAQFVKTTDNLDLIQLISFGCGLDAVTAEEVSDILTNSGKIFTGLKIDEVSNLGAARIRVRSLLAAIRVRNQQLEDKRLASTKANPVLFTEDMQDTYTILLPQMSPIHFELIEVALNHSGYKAIFVDGDEKNAVDVALKYVNHDACYPALIVVGQFLQTIMGGKYNTDKIAVLMTQTGGGCRASNYVSFIRRALKKSGYGHIPVIAASAHGFEKHSGFNIDFKIATKCLYSLVFGDIFMKCLHRMRPYEAVSGSADELHKKWLARCSDFLKKSYSSRREMKKICRDIIRDFDNLPILDIKKPKVGVVGEILVKFMPAANNYLVDLLESEGAEAVVPDLLDFFAYAFYNENFKTNYLGFKKFTAFKANLTVRGIEWLRAPATKALKASRHFDPPHHITHLAGLASDIVSMGNQTGEGWLLTAEMVELIHSGAGNIVCAQPFACLPNHVVGKGVIKELRRRYPESNIVAIDYDPGASEVNQLNRIKLMLSTANKNLK